MDKPTSTTVNDLWSFMICDAESDSPIYFARSYYLSRTTAEACGGDMLPSVYISHGRDVALHVTTVTALEAMRSVCEDVEMHS